MGSKEVIRQQFEIYARFYRVDNEKQNNKKSV